MVENTISPLPERLPALLCAEQIARDALYAHCQYNDGLRAGDKAVRRAWAYVELSLCESDDEAAQAAFARASEELKAASTTSDIQPRDAYLAKILTLFLPAFKARRKGAMPDEALWELRRNLATQLQALDALKNMDDVERGTHRQLLALGVCALRGNFESLAFPASPRESFAKHAHQLYLLKGEKIPFSCGAQTRKGIKRLWWLSRLASQRQVVTSVMAALRGEELSAVSVEILESIEGQFEETLNGQGGQARAVMPERPGYNSFRDDAPKLHYPLALAEHIHASSEVALPLPERLRKAWHVTEVALGKGEVGELTNIKRHLGTLLDNNLLGNTTSYMSAQFLRIYIPAFIARAERRAPSGNEVTEIHRELIALLANCDRWKDDAGLLCELMAASLFARVARKDVCSLLYPTSPREAFAGVYNTWRYSHDAYFIHDYHKIPIEIKSNWSTSTGYHPAIRKLKFRTAFDLGRYCPSEKLMPMYSKFVSLLIREGDTTNSLTTQESGWIDMVTMRLQEQAAQSRYKAYR